MKLTYASPEMKSRVPFNKNPFIKPLLAASVVFAALSSPVAVNPVFAAKAPATEKIATSSEKPAKEHVRQKLPPEETWPYKHPWLFLGGFMVLGAVGFIGSGNLEKTAYDPYQPDK
jgi:hypothetical protein